MEHPQAFANSWIILEIIGVIIGIGYPIAFFWAIRELDVWRNLILLYLCVFRGLDQDPGRPAPPESWEEFYDT